MYFISGTLDCTASGNAISLQGMNQALDCRGNTIFSSGMFAIRATKGTVIQNCVVDVSSGSQDGIVLADDGIGSTGSYIVQNVSVTGASGNRYGLLVEPSSPSSIDVLIEESTFPNNRGFGIGILASTGVAISATITNVVATAGGRNGFLLFSSGGSIEGNLTGLTGNNYFYEGLFFYGRLGGPVIVKNSQFCYATGSGNVRRQDPGLPLYPFTFTNVTCTISDPMGLCSMPCPV
jgi:hypothetical protein